MTEAAELALETLKYRNELLSKEGRGIEVEVFEVFEGPGPSG
jgi:hypothetical protein